MKTALRISLVLNAGLLAGLIFVGSVLKPRGAAAPAALWSPTNAQAAAAATASLAPATQNPPRVDPAPFRWSQLEAKDYHDYVKNLRSIGCPEGSVRAIVEADVHAAFHVRVKELEKELADADNSSWTNQVVSVKTVAGLKHELADIPEEEAAEVADLLGLAPAANQVVATKRRHHQPPMAEPPPVSVPLVFQPMDLTELGLDDDQMQQIKLLQDQFTQQIGGTNQDPNDPAYLARWQRESPGADSMFQAILGQESWGKYLVLQMQHPAEDTPSQ